MDLIGRGNSKGSVEWRMDLIGRGNSKGSVEWRMNVKGEGGRVEKTRKVQ